MFACRSRPARVKSTQRIRACLIPSQTEFSTVASVRQAAHVEVANFENPGTRLPLALQAFWYEPFRRAPTHNLPVCDLRLSSYSVRNLEFMCDFSLRAAYYCHLPAAGPVPLPKKTERWTVPRGHFVHKKSQENYERVTYNRLIQIKDGHPETVELWLAFLRKHQYNGVGMKANMFGFDELGVGKVMNISLETTNDIARPKWSHFGSRKSFETAEKVRELLESEEYSSLSQEDALEKVTDIKFFQDFARGILENPKYQEYVKEQKESVEESVDESVVMEDVMMGEEKVQAKAVEDALEKIGEVEAPIAEEAPKLEEVQATPAKTTPEPRDEASAAEPVAREVITNLKKDHVEERKAPRVSGREVEERWAVPQEQEVSPSQVEKTLDKRPKDPGEREALVNAAPTPIVKETEIADLQSLMQRMKLIEQMMIKLNEREARLEEREASLGNREKNLDKQKANLERETVATPVEAAPPETHTNATSTPAAAKEDARDVNIESEKPKDGSRK